MKHGARKMISLNWLTEFSVSQCYYVLCTFFKISGQAQLKLKVLKFYTVLNLDQGSVIHILGKLKKNLNKVLLTWGYKTKIL